MVAVLLVVAGCGVKFDPKTATFYRGPQRGMVPRATTVSTTRFDWQTTEGDPDAFLEMLARRATRAGIVSSRTDSGVELRWAGSRLSITRAMGGLHFECWANDEATCRAKLQSVIVADEP